MRCSLYDNPRRYTGIHHRSYPSYPVHNLFLENVTMKIILERHAYAPELNCAYVGPTRSKLRVPGCTTIRDARRYLFAPLKYTGRLVALQSKNVPDFATYDRSASGYCNDMRSLSGALRSFRMRHNIPGCQIIVTTKLVG